MANYAGAGGRPRGRRGATPEQKDEFFRLVDVERMAPTAAAVHLGFSAMSGTTWMRKRAKDARIIEELAERDRQAGEQADANGVGHYRHPRTGSGLGSAEVMLAPPKHYDQLGFVAKCAVDESVRGFEIFRRRYLRRRSRPWQLRAVADLLAAEAEARRHNRRHYALVNVFPGGGKSTTLTHDYVVWRTTCARVRRKLYRVQLGAEAITQSRSYVTNVRSTFETNLRLIEAYGRFKPLKPILWMTTAITIDYPIGTRRDEKEPTFFAVSKDSAFLGFRCEIAIWDDLVSKKTSKTTEGRLELRAWWVAEAQSRVNPRGLCVLVGTRVHRDDLFAELEKVTVVETDEADVEQVERRIYQAFRYPVHDETRCADPNSVRRGDHVQCLSDPDSYPWGEILQLKALNATRFELTYQQRDTDLPDQLVKEIWITGGDDARTGDTYIGCLDRDRALLEELPPFALEDYRAAITIDPSPTQWWSVQAWVWDRRNDVDYLVYLNRRRMQAGDLLDLKPGTLNYSGELEEVLLALRKIRIDCHYVILERNAAQRFMLQYAFFREWARLRNVIIRGHDTTGTALLDEQYGIQTLGPRYMHGQVRLPMSTLASRGRCGYLIKEALAYTGEKDEIKDCLMAQWFFHFNRGSLSYRKHQRRYYSSDEELSPRLAAVRHGKAAW